MKSAIEQEIEWCEAHMGESANGIEFEKGFIAGLKQALRFEKAVEQLRAADGSDDPQPGTLDYWAAVTSKDAGNRRR